MMTEIRFAVRTWRKTPGVAAVAVATIALGIGATTALFSVVNAVLLRSFGYTDSDRLIEISGRNKQGQQTGVSAPDFQAIQQRAHSFDLVGMSRVQAFTLTGVREPVNVYGQLVTRECFAVLGTKPLMGRVFVESDYVSGASAVALFSFKLWQRDFAGDSTIVGRRLLIDGTNYTVIGVMPPEFQFPHPAFLMWAPWQLGAAESANRRGHSHRVVARLRANVTRQMAASDLDSIAAALVREFPDTNTGWRAVAEPLNEQLLGHLRPALWTMLGAVGFVMLIACVNVSSLLMARGVARTREIAIRSALGGSRKRIAGQLLCESVMLAFTGGIGGLLFAQLWLKTLLALAQVRATPLFPRLDQASLDGGVLGIATLLTMTAGIIFGLAPALELSRVDIETALRESGRSQSGSLRGRRWLTGLIVLEAAMSVILLVGAGLMLRSFTRIMETKPGFEPEHVVAAEIPSPWQPNLGNAADRVAAKQRYFRDLLDRISRLPGISSAGFITGLPMGTVASATLIRLEGRNPTAGEDLRVGYSSVSAQYFRTMGIPLVRGRWFDRSDSAGRPMSAIVNETMARHVWPNEDAVGRRFTFNANGTGPWTTVVGVAGDVRNGGLRSESESQVYMNFEQSMFSPQSAAIVVRTGLDTAAAANALRTTIHEVDPQQPVSSVTPMSQVVTDSVAQPRVYTALLTIFGGLALVLAAAGIFSVLSWTVNQRSHDIAIRVALGATSRNVIGAIMGRALVEASVGAIAGLGGAWALSGILKAQLYQTAPTDPLTFAGAPLVLLAVAAFAAWLPAHRASRVDPAGALSTE
jgi:putative ABC transport system permease protein